VVWLGNGVRARSPLLPDSTTQLLYYLIPRCALNYSTTPPLNHLIPTPHSDVRTQLPNHPTTQLPLPICPVKHDLPCSIHLDDFP
jgi:hypothetical protein